MLVGEEATFLMEWYATTVETFGVWFTRNLPQGTHRTHYCWLFLSPQTSLRTQFLIPSP